MLNELIETNFSDHSFATSAEFAIADELFNPVTNNELVLDSQFEEEFYLNNLETQASSRWTLDEVVTTSSADDLITGLDTEATLVNVVTSIVANNTHTVNGSLDTTDTFNPDRFGTFRDDYLLQWRGASRQIQLNLDSDEFDTYLQLLNPQTGELIDFDNDSGLGLNSQLTFTAERGTNYIIRATSFAFEATGDYTLSGTATPLPEEQTITGNLESTDTENPLRLGRFRDDYLLQWTDAPQEIEIDLSSSDFDTYLQLVDAETGNLIDFNDNFGFSLNSQLTLTAQTGVDYIVRVTSFGFEQTGEYNLEGPVGLTPTTIDDSVPSNFSNGFGNGFDDINDAIGVGSDYHNALILSSILFR